MYQPSCTNNVLKIQVFYIKDFDLIKSSFNTYIDISTYIVYTHTRVCVCVCVYTHTYEWHCISIMNILKFKYFHDLLVPWIYLSK